MKAKGFTLVEIMVALMLLSFISVGALASLYHMMRSKEKQQVLLNDAEALTLAYAFLENDLAFMAPMPLNGEDSVLITEDEAITFTRTLQQYDNNLNDYQTLSYFVNDTQLERSITEDDIVYGQTVLKDVKDLHWTWLIDGDDWVETHQMMSQKVMPRAAKIEFVSPTWGVITWLFETPH